MPVLDRPWILHPALFLVVLDGAPVQRRRERVLYHQLGIEVLEGGMELPEIGDDTNNFTISYRVQVGGGRLATEVVFTGYLNGSNDTALIQAYDFVGGAWETRATFDGQNGTVNQVHPADLLARNTGTSGVELGQVLVRIKQGAASSSPTLNIDSLLVEAVGVGQTAGYQNGSIWVDTNNGVAGTESYVNGTADNPVLTWADALTLSAALGIQDFHIINGSSITLTGNSDNFSLFGDNWTLALGGQSIVSGHFEGAAASGTSTGANSSFDRGAIGNITVAGPFHFNGAVIDGTITLDASEVEITRCTMGSSPGPCSAPTSLLKANPAPNPPPIPSLCPRKVIIPNPCCIRPCIALA